LGCGRRRQAQKALRLGKKRAPRSIATLCKRVERREEKSGKKEEETLIGRGGKKLTHDKVRATRHQWGSKGNFRLVREQGRIGVIFPERGRKKKKKKKGTNGGNGSVENGCEVIWETCFSKAGKEGGGGGKKTPLKA